LRPIDGLVANNLGRRAFYTTLSLAEEPGSQYNEPLNRGARQTLIMTVNAFAMKTPDWVLERYVPSTGFPGA
jgi:hypothetical protein